MGNSNLLNINMGNCAGFCQAEGGTDSNEHQMR